jgi:hypothetical protein
LHEESSLGNPDSGNYYFSICSAINITMYFVFRKIPYCRLLLRRFKISWFLVEGKKPFSMHRKVNFGDPR